MPLMSCDDRQRDELCQDSVSYPTIGRQHDAYFIVSLQRESKKA